MDLHGHSKNRIPNFVHHITQYRYFPKDFLFVSVSVVSEFLSFGPPAIYLHIEFVFSKIKYVTKGLYIKVVTFYPLASAGWH